MSGKAWKNRVSGGFIGVGQKNFSHAKQALLGRDGGERLKKKRGYEEKWLCRVCGYISSISVSEKYPLCKECGGRTVRITPRENGHEQK